MRQTPGQILTLLQFQAGRLYEDRLETRALPATEHMSDVSNIIKSAKENLEKQFESFHSDFSRTTGKIEQK